LRRFTVDLAFRIAEDFVEGKQIFDHKLRKPLHVTKVDLERKLGVSLSNPRLRPVRWMIFFVGLHDAVSFTKFMSADVLRS
jgi:hypothetical protein